MIRRRTYFHQRKFITLNQLILKTFQTTWTQITQPSHNQLALVLAGLLSTSKRNNIIQENSTTTTSTEILETKELLKRFMDLHQTTRAYCHNHGEEHRKLTQLMDSRTHLGNGLIRRVSPRKSIIIITTTSTEILETKALLKRFTVLHQMTRVFSHNHGEELRKHTQLTDSRIHLGNGLIRRVHSPRKSIIITTKPRPEILVMKEFLKRFTNSHQLTNQSSHNHGEEQR